MPLTLEGANTMAILYKHANTGEAVEKEPWRWRAIYVSGDERTQFEITDDGPLFRPFSMALAKGEPMVALRLESDHQPYVEVAIPAGAKPIHMYKNSVIHHEQTLEDGEVRVWEERVRWYVIGYERPGCKAGIAITDAGRVVLTEDLDGLIVTSKGAY